MASFSDNLTDYEFEFTTDEEFDSESGAEEPVVVKRQPEVAPVPKSEPKTATRAAVDYDKHAQDYINFTNANPTTFHAIHYFRDLLKENGFQYIQESKPLTEQLKSDLGKKGGLFYSIRSDLTLVAFVVGPKWEPSNGIGIIGSHMDALTAKLKPISLKSDSNGYQLLGVAPYSGTLNRLWLDRDLAIGGKILVKGPSTGKFRIKLIKSDYPIAKIPSIAEHYIDFEKQRYNKETNMAPIIGYTNSDDSDEPTEEEKKAPLFGKHSIHLLRLVSQISGIPLSDIFQLDLELYDSQRAVRGGLSSEFVFAPRVDDRLCSFAAIYGLLESVRAIKSFEDYDGFQVVNLVDNEEIGSATRTGARGKFMNAVISRVLSSKSSTKSTVTASTRQAFSNSIILSADVTHALNPNFADAYLKNHAPVPNKGLTVKQNPNWRNMTDSTGLDVLHRIAEKNGLELQSFHIKNGEPSGGTIGPMISCDTGSRTVDVGLSQLSMHSIRAMFGYKEVGIGIETFSAFFNDWQNIYQEYDS